VAELPRLAAGAAQDARQLRGKYLIFHRAHLFLWDFRPRRDGLYRQPEIWATPHRKTSAKSGAKW
jgi:hypothetical protein